MNNTQKLDSILSIVTRTESKTDAVLAVMARTAEVAQALRAGVPVPPPIMAVEAVPQVAKTVRAKSSKTAQPKGTATIVTDRAGVAKWYALGPGTVRDHVGMTSKASGNGPKGPMIVCTFKAKKGKTATQAQISKAVAVVK